MKQQTERKTMKQNTETIPCALCGRSLDKRADKNNKPYFVCESCGTQYFIRGTAGRERLSALLEVGEFSTSGSAKRHRLSPAEQKALLDDLDNVQSYIESFCEDDLVIPYEPFEIENAIPFPEWSAEVCTRISKAIDPFRKR
jgi:hypothetical protein